MIQRLTIGFLMFVLVFNYSAHAVYAHAVVKPAEVGIGSFTDFTVGVPSEKEAATIKVKLSLPPELEHISPIVKPGWQVNMVTDTNSVPTAIEWTGGEIPGEQKDFFMFSAQNPSETTELLWKIEQTYADGSMVSWSLAANESQPKDTDGQSDYSKFGPASKTTVVNDLQASSKPVVNSSDNRDVMRASKFSLGLSVLALALAVISLVWQVQSRKRK